MTEDSRKRARPDPGAPSPLASRDERLLEESIRDPLTGLFHHLYFEASLEREIHRMERRGLPLGVILLEVDGFEALAAAHGRGEVESLLRAVADLMRRRVRAGDVASRIVAGQFAVILPTAPLEGIRTRAEQLRQAIRDLQPMAGESFPAPVTVSVGVAAFPDNGLSSEKLLRAARGALDQSRSAGRDRITTAPSMAFDRRLMLPE